MYLSLPDHLIRLIPARRDGEIDCTWPRASPARARAHRRSGMSSQCISAEIDCVHWRCQDFWTRCGVLRKGHQSVVESRGRERTRKGRCRRPRSRGYRVGMRTCRGMVPAQLDPLAWQATQINSAPCACRVVRRDRSPLCRLSTIELGSRFSRYSTTL